MWNKYASLLSKDHIKPKAHGGTNHLDNLQTLCTICNNIKGDFEMSNDTLRELIKEKYKEHYNGILTHRQPLQESGDFPI